MQPEQRSRTILVVDDEAAVANQLAELFRRKGYRTIGVTSGEEALRVVDEEGPPGMVLLDIIMPSMSGIEVLSRLHEQHPKIPVCMLTAMYDEHLMRASFRLGAFDYVTKPIDFEHLENAVMVHMFDKHEPSEPTIPA